MKKLLLFLGFSLMVAFPFNWAIAADDQSAAISAVLSKISSSSDGKEEINQLSKIDLPSAENLGLDKSSIPTIDTSKTGSLSSLNKDSLKSSSSKLDKKNYLPRLYISGFGGVNHDSYDTMIDFSGKLDILMPIFLRFDKNLYIYGQGNYAMKENSWQKDSWSGSLGLGYRQLFNKDAKKPCSGRIWGFYLLGDYNSTQSGHTFMDLNPGIETLGERWDFRVNGYIPIGAKKWDAEYWASDLGDYSHYDPESSPHEILDSKYIYHEEAGTGLDAEFGLKLFSIKRMPFKMYVEGYYYSMTENDDVFGGGARLTFQPAPYLVLEARYTYDTDRKNELLGGLRININQLAKYKDIGIDDSNIQFRLYDQIERNFATQALGNTDAVAGGPRHSGTPLEPDDVTPPIVKDDNVWYFDYNVTDDGSVIQEGDPGTYTNPYGADDFNQETIDYIESAIDSGDHADIYLKSDGGDNNYTINGNNNSLELYPDMNIYGKSGEKYESDDYVNIYGGVQLDGNNTLSYLNFYATSSNNTTAIALQIKTDADYDSMENGSTIYLEHVNIKDGAKDYSVGVNADNNSGSADSALSISDSNIYAMEKGVNAINTNVTINNSDISAVASSNNQSSYGIYFGGSDKTLLIQDSSISSASSSNQAIGIYSTGNNVTIDNSDISAVANTNSQLSYGIYFGGSDKTLLIQDSSISSASSSNQATGVYVDNANVNFYGSNISTTGDQSTGVYAGNNSTVNFYGSSILADGYTSSIGVSLNSSTFKMGNKGYGNATIIAGSSGDLSKSASSYGIKAVGNSSVYIADGDMNSDKNTSVISGYGKAAYGVYADGGSVYIYGGSNISAQGGYSSNNIYGFYLSGGGIATIYGTYTTISSYNYNQYSYDQYVYGVYINGSTVTMNAGNILADGYSLSVGFGVEAENNSIFKVSSGTISASGPSATGIGAVQSAVYLLDGVEPLTISISCSSYATGIYIDGGTLDVTDVENSSRTIQIKNLIHSYDSDGIVVEGEIKGDVNDMRNYIDCVNFCECVIYNGIAYYW